MMKFKEHLNQSRTDKVNTVAPMQQNESTEQQRLLQRTTLKELRTGCKAFAEAK